MNYLILQGKKSDIIEYKQNEENENNMDKKITEIFHKYLFREPDHESFTYFKQQIMNGMSYEWFEGVLKNCDESKQIQKLKEEYKKNKKRFICSSQFLESSN